MPPTASHCVCFGPSCRGLLARGVWWYVVSGRRINVANHVRIREGMSLKEVEALLGGPPGVYKLKNAAGTSSKGVVKGKIPLRKGGWMEGPQYRESWVDLDDGEVRVDFDAGYKVVDVQFSPKP